MTDVVTHTLPLMTAIIGRDGYTPMDRYRDFRAVFLGTPTAEQQQRVLFQILDGAGVGRPLADTQNVHETFKRLGAYEFGMEVQRWITVEPPSEMPIEAERYERE